MRSRRPTTARAVGVLLLGAAVVLGPLGASAAPAQAAPTDPGPVTGRLISTGGDPLPGVTVRLTAYGEHDPLDETTTADDGTFTIDGSARPAAFVLVACADDAACDDVWQATDLVTTYVGPGEQADSLALLHGYFTTDADPGTADPAVAVGDVTMLRPGTVKVVDRSGQTYHQNDGISISGLLRRPGEEPLTWPVLAPGTHHLVAGNVRRTVSVASGQSTTVRLDDRPAVEGRVLVGGRPVRGEPVVVNRPSSVVVAATRTDRTGRFRLGPLPVHQRLLVRIGVRHEAYVDAGSLPKRVVPVTLRPGEVRSVSVTAPRGSLGAVSARLAAGGTRTVQLRTAAGVPLGQLPLRHGRAGTGGLAPGRYVVEARWHTWVGADGFDADLTTQRLRVRSGHTTHLRLAPTSGPGAITAHTTAGSFVRLRAVGSDRVLRARTSGAGGLVRITGLEAGRYDLTAARDDGATESAPVRVRVGAGPSDVSLPAPPEPGSVRVRPVDADTGQPWPWTPEMAGYLGCGGLARLDAQGDYVGAAEPGTYRDCGVWGVMLQPGTPEYRPGGAFPLQGPLVVEAGHETTGDVAIDLTP